MKIEKMNDHQIRCTLTSEDLATRNIKLSELAYGSEKTRALFRDMMQQAAMDFGFEAEDIPLMDTDPGKVRANAYDMVINGVEVGGGSIRIHDSALQSKMFDCLGFTHEAAQAQFGFLMGAFKFGAPPHGGIAFGFDRLASMFAGLDSIRDVIAFPKNNSGRDVMIDSPSEISPEQFKELGIQLKMEN